MFVIELSLTDFRNYTEAKLELSPGVNVFVGSNGQGKTNLVEAVEYLSTMTSHRVAATAPLIRAGAESAILRGRVQAGRDDDRIITVELEVANGRSNVARLNRAPLTRPRDLVGALRTVVFSPVDLAIVRGDPSDRRGWLDSLVVTRWPRMAGVRQDFERVLKQRNALLKSMSGRSLRAQGGDEELTLDVWNEQLAAIGAELLHARLDTLADVLPHVQRAYATIAPVNNEVSASYKTTLDLSGVTDEADVRAALAGRLLAAMGERRREEVARGVTLVGPQRDDVELSIGALPAKGYASHGESWSLALALRLGGFALVRDDGTEPVLVLDDVFAELDTTRRDRLAGAIVDAEQVLITAAVGADVPDFPSERRFRVEAGTVQPLDDAAAESETTAVGTGRSSDPEPPQTEGSGADSDTTAVGTGRSGDPGPPQSVGVVSESRATAVTTGRSSDPGPPQSVGVVSESGATAVTTGRSVDPEPPQTDSAAADSDTTAVTTGRPGDPTPPRSPVVAQATTPDRGESDDEGEP